MYATKPRTGVRLNLGHPLSRGMIGAWLFNEKGCASVLNLAPWGGTTGFTNNVSWSNSVKGTCLNFDGASDYINVGTDSIFQPDAWTVASCVKPDNTGDNLLCGWGISSRGIYLQKGSGGLPMIYLGGYAYFAAAAWTKLIDGDLHQVVASMPGGASGDFDNAKFYVDAVSYARGTTYKTTQTAKTEFIIGDCDTPSTWYDYDGDMLWLYFWNRQLSAGEVAELYKNPYCMFGVDEIELFSAATQGGGAPPSSKPYYYNNFASRRSA